MQRSGCSRCPPHTAGRGCGVRAFHLWFLLDLTHTIRVFLLFIHREIAHP